MPLQRLEPCGSKDPCTVLRGLDAGDRVWLPGIWSMFVQRSKLTGAPEVMRDTAVTRAIAGCDSLAMGAHKLAPLPSALRTAVTPA
jgi:hypothetical protein